MKRKTWALASLALLLAAIAAISLTVIVIDPFQVYRPATRYLPPIDRTTQVYANAGVARSYAYDSAVVGTSVTENFRPSQMDSLLGGRFIKLCTSAGTAYNHALLMDLAFRTHDIGNIGAAIASGTFETEGMAVVPCSMKTLAGICHGYAENLLLRAADVTLKERRKLVLVARETPLGLVHLRNMTALAEMGVTILPPMLTYYQHPQSIEDMTTHIVGKIMREFRLEAPGFRRWEGS